MKKISLILLSLLFAASLFANQMENKLDSIIGAATEPFDVNVSEFSNVGSVISDDGKLRVISWNNRSEDGVFEYYTYFIYKKKAKAKTLVSKFVTQNAIKPETNGKYTANNWYGALYYKVVATKEGYILLGYQTYQDISRVKVIEPLKIGASGVTLGDDVFLLGNKKQSRAVFEYSANATMSIEYFPALKCFVFDHLSPENPNLNGIYQYYGPDFTYDSFTLKKKLWRLTEDIDIKNKD